VTATNSHGHVDTTTVVTIIMPPQVFHFVYLPVTNK
jgi:hypothetical protein